MKNCSECNKEFNEYPERLQKYQKKYCSQSCGSKASNRLYPKKIAQAIIKCIDCGREVLKKEQKGRKVCTICREYREENYLYKKNPTRQEMVYEELTRAAAFAYIRWHAKDIVMKNVEKKCAKCGYTNHVEACHIKSIASFNDDDRLDNINHPSNLMYMCPNHHWEHDFMKVVGVKSHAPS